jgi:ATP-dependent DNA helicase RecQ
MGIDKPDVRWIVHWDLPKDLEGYYQEIGRAGRDGLEAECLLLYGRGDLLKLKRFLELDSAGVEDYRNEDADDATASALALDRLEKMAAYAETEGCRRAFILSHFGERYPAANCAACDNCLRDPDDLVDLTVPAQKFLSCVVRLGNRFGAAHATDVLLGANTEKIERYGHGSLSVYGIGTELNRAGWMELARRLTAAGYLRSEPPYGVLSITAKGKAFFGGGTFQTRPIEGTKGSARGETGNAAPRRKSVDRSGAATGGSKQDAAADASPAETELFERLRALRKKLADESSVPPYVVFPDRTLRELARRKPRSEEDLEGVFGVGAHKAERYGAAFVREIRAWSEET